MLNEEGRIYYGLGLDNSQLQADANQAMSIIRGIGDRTEVEGARIDNTYKKIAGAVAGIFTVQKAIEFAKAIVQVRGEIESLEISFETLLGSKEKADALFSQIRSFAADTPMELGDLAKGAQTLLSFNIEAEKVMPILKQIGDISMGESQKFNSLVLAFSQMSSTGKLMGQDLLQMINAGFNPLTVIAEKTGKSITQLKDDMSAGAISADMVAEAFASAASAGGQFHGMLEKQSKGINGSISNLKGAIDDMFNDLGTKSQGVITTAIGGATALVKHYREIGEILAVIVAAYGTYKAAIIATEAVRQSLNTIRYAEEATQLTKLLTAEQQARISKLGLTKGSLEHSAAVKAETASNIQAAQVALAKARTEVKAANQVVTARRAEYIAAKQLDRQRLAELMSIGATGTARQIETAQRNLATAAAQKESAALAFQNATRDFHTKKITVETAAKQVNTLTTSANTAAQTANVTSTGMLAAAKLKLSAVAAKLNAVIMANPYMLAAAAIAALSYGIYKLITAETAAEAAQRKHNEAMEAAKEKKENLISKTQQLINKINDETQTIYSQIKAWKELQKEMPEAFANMTMQEFKNMKPEEREKLVNKTADNREIVEFNKSLEDAENRVGSLKKRIEDTINIPSGNNGGLILVLSKQLKEAEETLKLKKEEKKQRDEIIRQAEFEAETDERKLAILGDQLKEYKRQYAEIEKFVPESERIAGTVKSFTPSISGIEKGLFDVNVEWGKFDWQTQTNIAQLNVLNGKIQETDGLMRAIQDANGKGITYAEAKSNAQKEYADAKKLVDDIVKNSKKYSQKAYEDAVSDLDKKKKAYQALGGDTATKRPKNPTSTKPKDYTDQLKREEQEKIRYYKDLEFAVLQAEIDAKEEGLEKSLAQNDLNFKKEIEQIERQKQDKLTKIQEWERTIWESENPDREKKGMKFTPKTTELSKDDNDQFEEIEKAAQKRRESADKELYDALIKQFGSYQQKRAALVEAWEKKIAGIPAGYRNEAQSQMHRELAELDSEYNKVTDSISAMFKDMSDKSVSGMRRIADEAGAMKDFVIAGQWDESQGNRFGITESQFKVLNEEWSKSPEKLEAVIKKIRELKNEADDCEGAFKKMSSGFKKIFSEGKDNPKKLTEGLNDVSSGLSSVTVLGEMFAETLRNIGGEESQLSKIADGISDVMEVANSTMQGAQAGAAFGPWGAAIGAAVGLASSLSGIFAKSHDAKKEKEIQRLQGQVDTLKKSYDSLGKAIDKAYSADAAKLIKQQDENLKRQKVLIEQQIKAEKEKKKSDKGKIKEWEDAIEEIDNMIEDNKEKAVDAIFGEDVKSAIDNFAQAYADAWAAGEDRAKAMKDVVKNMIKGIVVEMLKSDLAPTVEKIRSKIQEYLTDGIIDATEQAELDRIIDQATKDADSKYAWADKYMKDEKENSREAVARGFATMSQDSADELNGRFTAMQTLMYEFNNNAKILVNNSNAILIHLSGIESNTKHCERLEAIESDMKAVKNGIEQINTRGILLKR